MGQSNFIIQISHNILGNRRKISINENGAKLNDIIYIEVHKWIQQPIPNICPERRGWDFKKWIYEDLSSIFVQNIVNRNKRILN